MIFTIEPSSHRIIATFAQKKYLCRLSGCSSPTCECESILIDFFPEDFEEGTLSDVTPLTVEIDLALWRKNDQECLLVKSEFATEVLGSMDEQDYEFLMKKFHSRKETLLEKLDFSTLVANFPFKNIELKRRMVAYLEIIPFAKPFSVEFKNKKYFIDDNYCVKLNCDCSSVCLTYFVMNQTQTRLGDHKNQEAFNYFFDYKKCVWKKLDDKNMSVAWRKDDDIATKSLEAAYPDLWQQLQKRHLQMRQAYAYYLFRRIADKASASSNNIGRNEPCPCGSGKKYKKCCGIRNKE